MTLTLLDANVLIALVVVDHIHHTPAEKWLASTDGRFATCPITEGSLIRLLIREGESAGKANEILSLFTQDDRHEFWPDSLSYRNVSLAGVFGHRQVTDAYLAQLARIHQARLASFDQGLAQLHSDVVDLVPTNLIG